MLFLILLITAIFLFIIDETFIVINYQNNIHMEIVSIIIVIPLKEKVLLYNLVTYEHRMNIK